jgi:hypothetical protein
MHGLSWAQNVNFRDRSSQQRVWRFPWRALRLPGRTIVRTLPAPPLHDGTRSRTGGPESDNLHSPRAATALCMLSVHTSFVCVFLCLFLDRQECQPAQRRMGRHSCCSRLSAGFSPPP